MKVFQQLATIILTLKPKGKANWPFQFFQLGSAVHWMIPPNLKKFNS